MSRVPGNLHAPFLEGWASAMGSGYSVNLQVRFLEGWAPAMAPGYSTVIELRQSYPTTIADWTLPNLR